MTDSIILYQTHRIASHRIEIASRRNPEVTGPRELDALSSLDGRSLSITTAVAMSSAATDSPRPNDTMTDREVSVSTTAGAGATDAGTAPNSVAGDKKPPTPGAAATQPGDKKPAAPPSTSSQQSSGPTGHTSFRRCVEIDPCFASLRLMLLLAPAWPGEGGCGVSYASRMPFLNGPAT